MMKRGWCHVCNPQQSFVFNYIIKFPIVNFDEISQEHNEKERNECYLIKQFRVIMLIYETHQPPNGSNQFLPSRR